MIYAWNGILKKAINTTYFDLFVLSLLGLIATFNWSNGDHFIKTVDSFFGFNPAYQIYSANYLWNHFTSAGVLQSSVTMVPFYTFLNFIYELGFTLVETQKIILFLLFTFSEFSIYFLLSTIFPSQKPPVRVAKLIASIFYVANPFTLTWIWWRQMLFEFMWILYPLIFALSIRLFKSFQTRIHFRYLILILISIMLLSAAMTQVQIVIMLFGLTMYFFYSFIFIQNKAIVFKKAILCVLIVLFVSTWWIIPHMLSMSTYYGASAGIGPTPKEDLLRASKVTSILNTIELLGVREIYSTQAGDVMYTWQTNNNGSKLIMVLSILFPIISFSALLFKKTRVVLFFTILSIVSIFIMKGYNSPLGDIILTILQLPFGGALRNSFNKFAILLVMSYTVLITYSVYNIQIYLKKYKNNNLYSFSFIGILTVLLFASSWPVWSGAVIYSGGVYAPSDRVDIPAYYYDAQEFMAEDPSFHKVLQLPISYWGTSFYNWSYGINPNQDPLDQYFFANKSIINYLTGNTYANRLPLTYYELFKDNKLDQIITLAQITDTKYLVLHKDWNKVIMNKLNPNLLDQNDYSLVLDSNLVDMRYLTIKGGDYALRLNGNSYGIILNSSNLHFQDGITIDIWVRLNSSLEFQNSMYPSIIAKMWYVGDNGFSLGFSKPEDILYFGFKDEMGHWHMAKYRHPILREGLWYHIVGVHNKTSTDGNLRLFVNGILVGSDTTKASIGTNLNQISIGSHAGELFEGDISELKIYNRSLTEAEILQNLNNQLITSSLLINLTFKERNKYYTNLIEDSVNSNYTTLIIDPNWSYVNEAIDKPNYINKIRHVNTSGELEIYEVANIFPSIYASSNLFLENESRFNISPSTELGVKFNITSMLILSEMSDLINVVSFPVFIFYGDNNKKIYDLMELINQSKLNKSNPNIQYIMVDPTKYNINVINDENSFVLVFSESYDKGWKAFINGNNNEQIPEEYHFTANGFANGWYITKTGNYTITLEYEPQKWFYLGATISLTTLLLFVLYLVYEWRWNKKGKKEEETTEIERKK